MDEETMQQFRLHKKKSVGKWSQNDFVFQGEGGKPAKYSPATTAGIYSNSLRKGKSIGNLLSATN
ncbi:hypothetical protein [Desulfosporosinus fructosivorans]